MAAVVKGIVLAILGGGLGAGGWALNGHLDKEPHAYTLGDVKDSDLTSTYEKNKKLGGIEKNKKLLVADIKQNQPWFEWVLEHVLNPKKSTDSGKMESEFSGATKGYGDETTALNKVCDANYNKGKSDYENTDNKRKNSVQWFCTPGGNKNIEKPTVN